LLELAGEREGKTVCPSEVARALDPEGFRALMPEVREVAARLASRGLVVVTQRGAEVDARTARGPIRIASASPYRGVDFRAHPELYRVGRGEEGVLSASPYKEELLPLFRFRTPSIARRSAIALWNAFVRYRRAGDFVGMDMARKFLQMGFTRSRRYANHPSGRKYDAQGNELPRAEDPAYARAAAHFRERWDRAERSPSYRRWRAQVEAAPPRTR
jgi:hypothetical protein